MATVDFDGVELFYERSGSGDRVVMTHGAWSDGRAWQAVTEHLSDRFEIVVWDRRGHSRSGDTEGPGSCRQDAADLAALIEHLDGTPVHAVGNSAGGNVVLNLVTLRPDLVKSAAVHEPGPFGLLADSDDRRLRELMKHEMAMTEHVERLVAAGRHREAARYFVDNVAVGPGAWDSFPDELKQTIEGNAATVPDDLRDGWDVGSVDLDALSVSRVPLLISTGTESPELEAGAARELARRVPALLEVIPGVGHIPHRTHPEEYAAMVSGFIARVESGSIVAGERR